MAYIKPAKPEHVYVKVTSDFDSSVWVERSWRFALRHVLLFQTA